MQTVAAPRITHKSPRVESTVNRLRTLDAAISAGRYARVAEYRTHLVLVNPMTKTRTLVGQFMNDMQAVLFAVSGCVRHSKIELSDVIDALSHTKSRFFDLNESQVAHLLGTRRVTINHRYDGVRVELVDDIPFELEIVPPDALVIREGRKFRA